MPSAKKFLSPEEEQLVLAAIADAELATSGEIRVHLENFCLFDPIAAARKIFIKLGMHATKERNGVLIYLATYSRKIAIVGDEGIHQKLGADFWDKMVKQMISHLHADHKAEGLVACIRECGEQLKHYFPRREDDSNELKNDISY